MEIFFFNIAIIIFQPCECNGCHDLLQKSMGFDDAAVVTFRKNDIRIHF